MPRVSTIISCYNDGAWVGRAIESALAQECPDHEIIVVDDGSTDDTPDVLARYGARIRVVRQANRGLPAARNAGMAQAAGAYVAFLDADDRFLPGKLARQAALLDRDPGAGMVYTDAWAETPEGRRLHRDSPRRYPADGYLEPLFLFQTMWHPSTVMARRSVVERAGGFDEALLIVEDREWYLRVAATARILDLRAPLVVKTYRPGTLSFQLARHLEADAYTTEQAVQRIPRLAAIRHRRDAIIHLRAGWYHLALRNFDAAIARFRRAIAADPRRAVARKMLGEAHLLAWLSRITRGRLPLPARALDGGHVRAR